ncbi:MarR family winged helix-turn-helix transcriptional regulator [Nocardia sp. NPDC060249]|uniref:MarR family winged helix-turn-helix transcriptional regulator n=1 Tax=Nocardia sp. NPDC060249 TaxID=3347082 RepID=UPI00364CB3E1
MSRAGVSKTLTKLERRGLIARTQNPTDRRSTLIQLTPAGIHLIDEVFPREIQAHAQLLADLNHDRSTVLHSLDRLARSLEARSDVGDVIVYSITQPAETAQIPRRLRSLELASDHDRAIADLIATESALHPPQ